MEKINTIELERKIRDKQNKEILGKSPQEVVEYFQKKSQTLHEKSKTESK